MYVCMHIYIYIYIYVCVCVCVYAVNGHINCHTWSPIRSRSVIIMREGITFTNKLVSSDVNIINQQQFKQELSVIYSISMQKATNTSLYKELG